MAFTNNVMYFFFICALATSFGSGWVVARDFFCPGLCPVTVSVGLDFKIQLGNRLQKISSTVDSESRSSSTVNRG